MKIKVTILSDATFAAILVLLTFFAVKQDLLFAKTPQPVQDSSNVTATTLVEEFHNLLIKSMKMGDKSTCSERFHFLSPFIEKGFDFALISRIVLGRRHWKQMDEKTREKFIEAFTKMTVATYARRFDSYSGQRFETVGSKPDQRGHYIVDAVLIKKDGDRIDFRYICKKVNGTWKIVSVSAKGVNDLSVKRADYNSFLKKHSIQELIEKLIEKAGLCLGKNKSNTK